MLGQIRGVHTGNMCVKSREFKRMNRLQACRVLAPLVRGPVWAWWMLLGRDFHWMMGNEAGGRMLPLKSLRRNQKYGISPEKLKIWVESHEYSRPIQTATYPPFTKGT